MSTLQERTKTALVVVDVQNAVLGGAHDRVSVVTNIAGLIENARRRHIPVIWVQHDDGHIEKHSDGWQLITELSPLPSEARIEKQYGDAFEDTPLESTLASLAVGRLIIVGAQTDACIRSTLHGAFVRGYDVVLVSDAHTTEDQTAWGAPTPELVIAHTNLYWAQQSAPGRTAAAMPSVEITF